MMTNQNSTRVRAPANTTPASEIANDDGTTLNPLVGVASVTPLNSSGGVLPDDASGVRANTQFSGMLRPKKLLNVSTFNVRTLSQDWKLNELIANAENHNIDVICLQEHRRFHEEVDIKYTDLGKWTLITSSATKNSVNATIGGVGFLISQRANAALNSVVKKSSHIISAKFNGNPCLNIISCHSPTNSSDISDVECFYEDISDVVSNVPKHNCLLLGGDFNAQLGHHFGYHQNSNRNGALLESIMTQFHLVAANTKYQKRIGKLWTITYGNGTKGQIDYILVNRKWLNSIVNCEAYNTFESNYSDHRIITAKIRLSVRAHKPKKRTNNYRWDELRNNDKVLNEFRLAVSNRFQVLSEETQTETDPEVSQSVNSQNYDNLVSAVKEAAEKTIPRRKKRKCLVPWEDDDILACRDRVKEASKAKRISELPEDKKKLKDTIAELESLYQQKQEEYVKKKSREIEDAHYNHKSSLVWKTVNEISGRKKNDTGRLNVANPEERLSSWKNHFKTLLGSAPPPNTVPVTQFHEELAIETGDFTMEELKESIKGLKNNKAAGLDEVPAEVWKSGILDQELLEFCNRTLNGDKPKVWSHSGIVPVPKKGNLSLTTNYRGISLTPIAAKIYDKMILKRLQPFIDPILRPNQNGFRKGRGTIGQILTLRRLIEGIKAKNLKAVLTFIDFRKAFDSIDRSQLMKILKAYGIPEKIVKAIEIMYTDTQAKVLSPDGETDYFEILAGVLQGDTLAPYLFIIAIDYVMRNCIVEELGFTLNQGHAARRPRKANKMKESPKYFTDSDYTDDLCLLNDSLKEAQEVLERLEDAAAEVGLYINHKKTKYMCFNQTGADLISRSGDKIDKEDDFLYLGSWVDTTERDLSVRIAKAWVASNKLEKIWKSNLDRKLKVNFFRMTVESVLLYGSECWTLTKQQAKKLDGCYTRLLRAATNVSWRQRLTNKVLYGDLPSVSQTVQQRRLRFAGHCYRAKQECVSSVILWEPTHGKRSVGRPAKT